VQILKDTTYRLGFYGEGGAHPALSPDVVISEQYQGHRGN